MSEEELRDALLTMGIGSAKRFGSVKVFRDSRTSWLVAAAGTARAFDLSLFAARWINLLLEQDAGF